MSVVNETFSTSETPTFVTVLSARLIDSVNEVVVPFPITIPSNLTSIKMILTAPLSELSPNTPTAKSLTPLPFKSPIFSMDIPK